MKAQHKKGNITPPQPVKINKSITKHGHKRTDPYYWMRERENPKVIQHLKKENSYTEALFKPCKKVEQTILNELKKRIVKDDESLPYFYNGYWYFTKVRGNQEYSVYLRKRKKSDKKSELLIDVNALAKGKSYCDEGQLAISPDNTILAYSMDFVGRRKYEIHFKTIQSGKKTNDVIPDTTGNCVWANDNKTVFYVLEDKVTLRSYKIMRHTIGQPVKKDVCVYEEKDERFYLDISKSKSDNYIFIHSSSSTTSEVLWINANTPNDKFKVFEPRKKGHEYSLDEAGGVFYIRTNLKAKNFKLVYTTEAKTRSRHWKNLLPYDEKQLIESFDVLKEYIAIEVRKEGLNRILVYNISSKKQYFITADEEDYYMGLDINEEYDTSLLRYQFGSMKTPLCTYEIDLKTKKKKLLKKQRLNTPYNSKAYTTKRVFASSRDGKKIPVSLFYKTKLYKKGCNPLLVYGYGSYGVIIDPYFSSSRLSLVDRGFVFAIVHTRGGEDLGRDWYLDGKMLKKKNTFNDFIDSTEYLIKQKYGHPEKVFAQGGSAGGMLMGVVINERPDLYKAIIADVPFVDVVTTMLDKTIPLTTGEYEEWGNPDNRKYYRYMLSYSPYDNIKEKAYPSVFISCGLHDSQVQYWEPAKWAAKLREHSTSHKPVLLFTNLNAGHGGVSGRFSALEEIAKEYTFLLINL